MRMGETIPEAPSRSTDRSGSSKKNVSFLSSKMGGSQNVKQEPQSSSFSLRPVPAGTLPGDSAEVQAKAGVQKGSHADTCLGLQGPRTSDDHSFSDARRFPLSMARSLKSMAFSGRQGISHRYIAAEGNSHEKLGSDSEFTLHRASSSPVASRYLSMLPYTSVEGKEDAAGSRLGASNKCSPICNTAQTVDRLLATESALDRKDGGSTVNHVTEEVHGAVGNSGIGDIFIESEDCLGINEEGSNKADEMCLTEDLWETHQKSASTFYPLRNRSRRVRTLFIKQISL